ncbi:MAG: creatininase family protein, partial [Rhodospirillales bacterium]|nr:creatininase family protein [Rhodospirillales bacterium]
PNGFIGTDALCPEILARGIEAEIGCLVAPTLPIGMAQHHLGFSGSITLRPTTLIAVVQDVVDSLAKHGFERFYFLNGHGGNIATVSAAFSEIYAEASLGKADPKRPPLRCKLKNWWENAAVQRISKERFGNAEGWHATCSEVSLTYYGYPQHRKNAEMSPEIAPTGPIYDSADYRLRFPDGRIGSNPALASAEAGKALFDAAVPSLAADFKAFAEAH